MKTDRQKNRINNTNDPYYFYNSEIKVLLKNFFEEKINTNLNCLDFGCGEKPFNSFFSDLGIKNIVSCDIAQNSKKNVDILLDKNTKKLPFIDGQFDFIFAFDVFEHAKNLEDITEELNRSLKPGGYILCTMPFLYKVHEAPDDYRRLTFEGLKELFVKRNFEVLNFKPLGDVFDVSHTIINEGIYANNLVTKILKKILIYQIKISKLFIPSKSFSTKETYFGCFFSLRKNF